MLWVDTKEHSGTKVLVHRKFAGKKIPFILK